MSTITTNAILIGIDHFLTGFSSGTTIWFFFIQSPLLIKLLGKEKFVPIMMSLTKLWVQTMFYSISILAMISWLNVQRKQSPYKLLLDKESNIERQKFCTSVLIAWISILINRFIIVPKALKAGAKSHSTRKGDTTKDLKEMAISGGGKSDTKQLHQTVVLFVVFMVSSLLYHLVEEAM